MVLEECGELKSLFAKTVMFQEVKTMHDESNRQRRTEERIREARNGITDQIVDVEK